MTLALYHESKPQFKLFYVFTDDDEEDWPTDLTEQKKFHIPISNGVDMSATLKRNGEPRRVESLLSKMSSMLAAAAIGFDIRVATTLHPNQPGSPMDYEREPSHVPVKRDAYFAAVRDSFIETDDDYRSPPFISSSGYPHHTYHGQQTRYRPTPNFEVPMVFGDQSSEADASRTPSTVSSSSSPQKMGNSNTTSPASEITYRRQKSEGSSNESPRVSKNRHSVTFEDDYNDKSPFKHKRTPSNTSSCSSNVAYDFDHYNSVVPQRRKYSIEQPERPSTLDVASPFYTPTMVQPSPSILKYSSPAHNVNRDSPHSYYTPSESTPPPTNVNPGSTPPRVHHDKTLLDIDVEGQSQDSTKPLMVPQRRTFRLTSADMDSFLQ